MKLGKRTKGSGRDPRGSVDPLRVFQERVSGSVRPVPGRRQATAVCLRRQRVRKGQSRDFTDQTRHGLEGTGEDDQ